MPDAGHDDVLNRLDAAVRSIQSSYESLGGINHIQGPNLPSREDIRSILDEILSLVFPGYVAPARGLDNTNISYFVGQRCSSILRRLGEEIAKSFMHECRMSQTCLKSRGECHQVATDVALGLLEEIPELRRILSKDVDAAYRGDPAAKTPTEVLLSYPCLGAISAFRIAHHLHVQGVPYIPRMITEILHGSTGIDIHPGATIGEGFFIDHGTGVVIGETSEIGKDVKIYQGVTLGALSINKDLDHPEAVVKRHPTIEDEVTLYAGATILGGKTRIGRGSVIGGNVWITRSVPPRTKVIVDFPFQVFTDMTTGKVIQFPVTEERGRVKP